MKKLILAAALLAPLQAHADSSLLALPAASGLTGSEYLYGIQGVTDNKITVNQIATFVRANLTSVPSAFSSLTAQSLAVTADGFNIGGQAGAYTADQIYEWAIGPGSNPAPAYDAVRGVAYQPAGSTILTTTGVAGYVLNDAVISTSKPASVALFGVGVGNANNSSTWGVDTILSDNKGQMVSAGTGRFLTNEFDFNVTSPSTTIAGLNIGGTALSQPASATGFTVGIGSGIHWNYGFGTVDGSATNFAQIGTIGPPGANVHSQKFHFNTYNSSGVEVFTELQQQEDYMVLAASGGAGHGNFGLLHGSYNAPSNEGFKVNFHTMASADSGANAYLGSDASFSTLTVGNGTAAINLNGPVTIPVSLWTPSLAFGGATTGITYISHIGDCQQTGRKVSCAFDIRLSSKGSATGAATITGLPLGANSSLEGAALIGSHYNMSGISSFESYIAAGSSVISLGAPAATSVVAITDANFTNTSILTGTATFFTN